MSLTFGKLSLLPADSVLYIVVHTQGAPNGADSSAAAIHDYHRNGRGWAGIGYHKVIRKDGRVEDGRPLDRMGAHVAGLNHASVGICCTGNGDMADFTPQQKASLVALVRELRGRFPRATVEGHREIVDRLIREKKLASSFATTKSCPGARVDMAAIRRMIADADPPRPAAAPPGKIAGIERIVPRPGDRRWSEHLKEHVILTRYVSDAEWYFVRESELAGKGISAAARWSEMPEGR